jgi:hypothetical protein
MVWLRPQAALFNGEPKASATTGNTVSFGLPLNDRKQGLTVTRRVKVALSNY